MQHIEHIENSSLQYVDHKKILQCNAFPLINVKITIKLDLYTICRVCGARINIYTIFIAALFAMILQDKDAVWASVHHMITEEVALTQFGHYDKFASQLSTDHGGLATVGT